MARHGAKRSEGPSGSGGWTEHDPLTGRFEGVMSAAERLGLLGEKSGRISGRVSPRLIIEAKKRTGLESDTELIEFALANLALDDNFAETFRNSRGKADPDLKLGF